jgi:hypothetical protein
MPRSTYALLTLLLGVLHGVRGLYLSPARPWFTRPVALAPLFLTLAIALWLALRSAPLSKAAVNLGGLWLGAIPVGWALHIVILADRAPFPMLLVMLVQLSWSAGLYFLAALACYVAASAAARGWQSYRPAV